MFNPDVIDYIVRDCGARNLSISACFGGSDFNYSSSDGEISASDSHYMLASLSKLITLSILCKVCDSECISSEAPVISFIPECSEIPGFFRGARIRDLVNHTAGMMPTTYVWDEAKNISLDDWFSTCGSLRFSRDFYGIFKYSNFNYQLLGMIIERVIGEPFIDVVRKFTSHCSSKICVGEDCFESLCRPHVFKGDECFPLRFPTGFSCYAPSTSLCSTAYSFNKYMHEIFIENDSMYIKRFYGGPYITGLSHVKHFASGFFVGEKSLSGADKTLIYGHGGKEFGYNAICLLIPQRMLSLTIIANVLEAPMLTYGFALLKDFDFTHPSSTPR